MTREHKFLDPDVWIRDETDDTLYFRHAPTRIIPYRKHNSRFLELPNLNADYMKDTGEVEIRSFDVTMPLSLFHESVRKQREQGTRPGVQEVMLTVEVMKDFQEHSNPFFELPRLGALPDWNEINSIAISVEWTCSYTGRKFSSYLHNHKRSVFWTEVTTRDYAFPGRIIEYAQGRALLDYLLRRQAGHRSRERGLRQWEFCFGLATLMRPGEGIGRAVFDQATRLPQTIQPIPRRPAKPQRYIVRRQLTHMGFKNVGKWHGSGDDDCVRHECDFCTLLASQAGIEASQICNRRTNEDGSFDDVCFLCHNFGRFCSWTPTETLTSSQDLQKALVYLRKLDVNEIKEELPQ